MHEAIPRVLFVIAIAGLAFAYGFITNSKEIFPYQIIREAKIAFDAIRELEEETPRLSSVLFVDKSVRAPTYRALSDKAGGENLFILGNSRTYKKDESGNAFLAWIADRNGNVVHAWKDPGDIWSPLVKHDAVGDTWSAYPIGAYLFPNGDILVSYQAENVFPISMGLAKFDKDSHLLWKSNEYYHHWFSVGPDGSIYVPKTLIGQSPMKVGDRDKTFVCEDERFPYESIAVLDANGVLTREIDLMAAFVNSDLTGVFNSNEANHDVIDTCDPLHLNDVQVLPDEPPFSAGDLLVSFRSLNGFGVLDPKTELFRWFYVGASHHQHSPRYLGNGRVIVFDNYGNPISRGKTRVLAVDVASHQSETLFPREGSQLPETTFFSQSGGHIDVSPARDRMMVSFSLQGLAWEIDVSTGEILWEFVNTHSVAGKPTRLELFVVKYVQAMDFEPNGGQI
jgi:hypothetical protein